MTLLQPKDFFAASALLVSVFALGTSFTTVYLTFLRKSYLRVRFGGTLLLQTQEGGRFRFMPEIVLHNEGAQPIVAYSISAQLRRRSDNSTEQLRWLSNLSTTFDPATRRTDTHFESFPSAIFIGKGEVVSTRLSLDTQHRFKPSSGDYYLEITILSDGCSNEIETDKCNVRISSEDLVFFDRNQPDLDKQTWRNRRFWFEYAKEVNSYLSGS